MKTNAQPAPGGNAAADPSGQDPQAWALAYLDSPEYWDAPDDDWTVNGGPVWAPR